MLRVILPAFLTGLATTVGAVPFLFMRPVSRRFYDTLLGLGAGLMLGAATLGLLATALAEVGHGASVDLGLLGMVIAGFSVGAAILYAMDRLIPHQHAGGHGGHVHDDHVHAHALVDHEVLEARKQGLLVVGAMSLHRIPEGLAIGAAWAGGGETLGLTLACAIAVQNAVEGAVMAAPLRRGGLSAPSLLALVTATGMSIPIAAAAGWLLAARVDGALPPMLGLAAGALVYLTCNEVIPESHSHGNEVRATFGVLAGFVLIMVMQIVFGH